jgi:hypothetical protein
MAFLRMVGRSCALVGLGAAWLQAQSTHAHVIVAPQGRPRIATIAPPPPTHSLTRYGETVFESDPIIITPDGRVLIDLGNDYEQVARTCSYAYGYDCQRYGYPTVPGAYPGYAPSGYDSPPYAPPQYAVPYYPAPVYPSGGYAPYFAYGPYYYPPSPGYAVCPAGFIPIGAYATCVDPYAGGVRPRPIPVSGEVRAAPRSRPAPATLTPRIRR